MCSAWNGSTCRYRGRDGRVSERQTRYNLDVAHYAFTTGFEYDELGNTSRILYPTCLHTPCAGVDPPRSVDYTYTRGFLTGIPGFASSIDYQAGGMLRQISHTNGVDELIEIDSATGLARPHRISTVGGATGNWDMGLYQYDGAGNIKAVGSRSYQYHRMSRMVMGQVEAAGRVLTQSVTYDALGNVTRLLTDGVTQSTLTSTSTNRLTGGVYDAGGNLTDVTLDGETFRYTYDSHNRMKHLQSTADQARVFIYDADDRRILTFDCAFVQCETQAAQLTATIRDLEGKMLREYRHPFDDGWLWLRDHVYRDGQLLATVELGSTGAEKLLHTHLDHLGSPLQITDAAGREVSRHAYFPFGQEATDKGQDKFTGHERDDSGKETRTEIYYMNYASSSNLLSLTAT